MANFNLGTLPVNGAAVVRSGETLTLTDPTDVFGFSINSTSNVNLILKGITIGDDADVLFVRDNNGNGAFDSKDITLANGIRTGTQDESITFADVAPGTYFAFVIRFADGSTGNVAYDLAVSTADPSNLLPVELNLGDLSGDVVLNGTINDFNTVDTYAFSLGFFEGVNIFLNGLSSDADIRLIQDNGNQIFEAGEFISSSTNGDSLSESISNIDQSANYFLQVYQFSGSTNYTLTFDYFTTPFA